MTMPQCFSCASTPLFLHLAGRSAETFTSNCWFCRWHHDVAAAYVGCYESVLWLGPLAHGSKLTLHTCCSSTRHPGSISTVALPPLCKRKNILACICKYIVHSAFYSYMFGKVLGDLSSCPALWNRPACTPWWYSWTYYGVYWKWKRDIRHWGLIRWKSLDFLLYSSPLLVHINNFISQNKSASQNYIFQIFQTRGKKRSWRSRALFHACKHPQTLLFSSFVSHCL